MNFKGLSTILLITCFGLACGEVGPGHPSDDHRDDQPSAQTAAATDVQLEWTRQIEEDARAQIRTIGTNGNVYVGGFVGGPLPGLPDGQGPDAFIRAYDADGNELWTDQIAIRRQDFMSAIAVDSTGVYAVGTTIFVSAMQGSRSAVFIRKYTHDGTELFTEVFEVDDRRSTSASDVALDDTGIYISGSAATPPAPGEPNTEPSDALIAKFDLDGNSLWTVRFGDPDVEDSARGIAVHEHGVAVSGWTDGSLLGLENAGGRDAFAAHFDGDGLIDWIDQFGSAADDEATGAASTDGRVHISGWTDGALDGESSAGGMDAFVRTYTTDGSVEWTDQFGTASDDRANAIAASASEVVVAGDAGSDLAGGDTAFARKYVPDGQPLWTFQFDDADLATASAVGIDGDAVYVAGRDTLAKLVERADEEPPDEEPPADCVDIDGTVVINSAADTSQLDDVGDCFDILGHLFIQDTNDLQDLSFLSGLRSVEGYVGIADNAGLTSLAGLESLESIGEGLVIEGNPELESITSLTSLETVEGEIHIFGNASLAHIALPALVSAGELLVAGNDALLTLSAPELVTIDSRLLIENNDVLHTVDLSSLQDVGSVRVRFNPALDNFIAPGLS